MKILVYPKDKNPYFSLLYEEMRQKINVHIEYLRVELFHSHTLSLILLPALIVKYKLKKYNIFHLHFIYPFGIANNSKLFQNFLTKAFFSIYFKYFLKLIKLLNFKIVWTVHEVIPVEKETINSIWARNFLSNICDAKIVHAKSSIDEMKKLGLNTDNTYCIPIGNYIGVYKNEIKKKKARKFFDLSNEDFVFLFFGIIKPYKGVEKLLEAFECLLRKRKNIKLLIAGPCRNENLKLRINKYQKVLKENAKIFIRFIEDDEIQYFFNCADIVVLPFEIITTSSSVLLSLSFGKPIICPKIGNLKELPDDIGFFYQPEDNKALFSSMEKAILNKCKLNKMSQSAFEYASSLSWDKISEKTYEIYKNIGNDNNEKNITF